MMALYIHKHLTDLVNQIKVLNEVPPMMTDAK